MNKDKFFKIRLSITAAVTLAIWSLLAWNHYHGGVPSHHILAREDLPSFSNWWGGLLLPLLTWFLLYRIKKRLFPNNVENPEALKSFNEIRNGFLGSLLFGVLLSCFFTLGYANVSGYMVIALFILALFFPIYRAEYLLGFVIGMTFTFGAVLPTGIGTLFALVGVVLYHLVRPGILLISSKLLPAILPNKNKADRP